MLNIKYKATFSFTSTDIRDVANIDPITYEIWANRPDNWTLKCKEFFESDGESPDLALDIVGLSLVSASQNNERWHCGNRTNAVVLRDSIEAQNPDYGDLYIRGLAVAIFDQTLKNEDTRLGNSVTPLAPSPNGVNQKQSTLAVKKA